MTAATDEEFFTSVSAQFRAGELDAGRAACLEFLRGNRSPEAQGAASLWLGVISARGGDHVAAADYFERGLAHVEPDPVWQLQAGLTYLQLDDLERAGQLLRTVVERQPGMALAHYNLGVLNQRRQDLPAARDAFRAALAHHANFAEAHTNLANVLLSMGDAPGAVAHYSQALVANPRLSQAHYGMALHYLRTQQLEAAREAFQATVDCDPYHWDAWLDLAELHYRAGNGAEAVACVERILEDEPDNAAARFKLGHYTGMHPESAPAAVIGRMYAGMADDFDEHLTQRLHYRVPAELARLLMPWLDEFAVRRARRPDVLDLGCGTGLLGVELRHASGNLTGIDLSAAMLAKARVRKIYDRLIENDLMSCIGNDAPALVPPLGNVDLVVATDVFIYVGKLDAVFAAVAALLSGGGRFAFSIESPPDLVDEFQLAPSGRYVHSPASIRRLAAMCGFEIIEMVPAPIREESGKILPGYLCVLEKSSFA